MKEEKVQPLAATGDRDILQVTHFHPNSVPAQHARILVRLRKGPATTVDFREQEDIFHPSGRIRELRELGYVISMRWTYAAGGSGVSHRVGEYALISRCMGESV